MSEKMLVTQALDERDLLVKKKLESLEEKRSTLLTLKMKANISNLTVLCFM